MNIKTATFALSLSLAAVPVLFAEASTKDSWHQWRGPHNNGVAEGDAPLHFSEREHVKWRIKIARGSYCFMPATRSSAALGDLP